MANVIKVLGTPSGNGANLSASMPFPAAGYKVKAGTTGSILPGYLVIKDGSNAGYVKAAPDATDSTSVILGVAADTSTETASVGGDSKYDEYVNEIGMNSNIHELVDKALAKERLKEMIRQELKEITGAYGGDDVEVIWTTI